MCNRWPGQFRLIYALSEFRCISHCESNGRFGRFFSIIIFPIKSIHKSIRQINGFSVHILLIVQKSNSKAVRRCYFQINIPMFSKSIGIKYLGGMMQINFNGADVLNLPSRPIYTANR